SGSSLSVADIDADPTIVDGGTVFLRGGQIDITNFSSIDTSGTQIFDPNFNPISSTAGGSVVIRGGELFIDSSTITSNTFGDTNGGAIDVAMTQGIHIT